jgi:3-oxoacyl-[acyl-carrier-protein] synthase III
MSLDELWSTGRSSTRWACRPERAAYLDDSGHMSGVDPMLTLDRAARADALADGDVVLPLAAGTGYTWAASSVVRWGASGAYS